MERLLRLEEPTRRSRSSTINNLEWIRTSCSPFADGTTEPAEVVGRDPNTEIAVLKVNRDNLPAAKFSQAEELIVGQLAVAIGSPSGFESTVTSGIISGTVSNMR